MGIYAMEVPYILSTYQFPAEFEIEVKENEIKEHGVTCYILHKNQSFPKYSLYVRWSNTNF